MEMSVLRLWIITIKFGEAHISYLAPLSGASLNISIVFPIERMSFDRVIERHACLESFLIACGTHIFRESIDGETNGIELLFGIYRITLIVEFPIYSSIFRVNEMMEDKVFSSRSSFEILRMPQHPVSGREAPEYSRIEDTSLISLFHQSAVALHLTIESTIFLILHLQPEGQNILSDGLKDFLFQYFHLIIHIYHWDL